MPITKDGSNIIQYTLSSTQRRDVDSQVFNDLDGFAICDYNDVLKQIKFGVNPTGTPNANGVVTIVVDVPDGNSSLTLTGNVGPSFGIVQTPSGTFPTASIATDTLTLATGTTGTDFNIVGSSLTDTVTFNIPDASTTARGFWNASALTQTVSGNKQIEFTFANEPSPVGLNISARFNNSTDNNGLYYAGTYNSIKLDNNNESSATLTGMVGATQFNGNGSTQYAYGLAGSVITIPTKTGRASTLAAGVSSLVGNLGNGTYPEVHGFHYDSSNTGSGAITLNIAYYVGTVAGTTKYGFYNQQTGVTNLLNDTEFTKYVKPATVALSDAATITVDASQGNQFTVTLGGNRTLGNPSNAKAGQLMLFVIRQDGSGNRTLSFDTKYRIGSEIGTPSIASTAAKTSYIGVRYHSTDDKFDIISFVSDY